MTPTARVAYAKFMRSKIKSDFTDKDMDAPEEVGELTESIIKDGKTYFFYIHIVHVL